MHVIIANFSDDSIALVQWAYENKLSNISVLAVETNWQAYHWHKRVNEVKDWLNRIDIPLYILKPTLGFKELVQERRQFPSVRFQWCPGLLKGMPILNWLEENDNEELATILLPHRRSMSKAKANLEEHINESEHYDDRRLWHPLYKHTETERNELVQSSGLKLLNHRSLECEPCIFSSKADLARLDRNDIEKVQQLEASINQTMFHPNDYQHATSIKDVVQTLRKSKDDNNKENYYDNFAMGCAWPYACGL